MENVMSNLAALSLRQKLVAGIASVLAVAAFVAILRIAAQPSMALLYSGLDASAAGEVVQLLEQQGAPFEVRGGAIYVDANLRDSLRMTLAAEGKPANGSGYELLDSLSGFGTTSQMFDAAYWRAKEGELARTITASPFVRTARVHISNVSQRPFARNIRRSASVTVFPMNDVVPQEQARAFRFLVASAVAGLDPDDVAVIDARAGRVVGPDDELGSDAGDMRAAELRRRAERILEARVGLGNAIVEVAVQTESQSEQIMERRLDPDSRVMISSDTEERSTASTDTRSGAVTVASNLPDGDAGDDGARSSSDNTETRERMNYEVSETTRQIVRSPGSVARLTVAVLVNIPTAESTAEGGVQARGTEELEALRELVASAVGFDESRGDVITIRSMAFETAEFGPPQEISLMSRLAPGFDVMKIIQLATLALVSIVLGLFVVRPILMRPRQIPQALRQIGADAGSSMSAPELNALPAPALGGALVGLGGEVPTSRPDTAQRLVETVGERQSDAASLLRGWMHEGSRA